MKLLPFRRAPALSDYFPADGLARIEAAVKDAEKRTSGEMRVEIIRRCDARFHGNIFDQALCEFERAGMTRTRDRTGVLVLVALKERKFQIIADSDIYARLSQAYFDERATRLSAAFRAGTQVDGVCALVRDVGTELARHFPRRPDDVNELPDGVIVKR